MRTLLLPFLILIFSLGLPIDSRSQKISATVSTQEASPGEVIKWTISIEGAKGSVDRLPNLSPFKLMSGPSTFLNMQYSFGQKIIQQEWTYHVKVPETEGRYTLPSVPVISGKRKYNTNPIIVTVVSNTSTNIGGDKKSNSEENPSSIIVTISKEKAHVGEQLILDGYIVSNQDIITLELNKAPFSPDIFLQELNIPGQSVQSIQINGKTYMKQLVYRAAIYPQRAGKISISPLQLRALARGDIVEDDPFAWLDNNIVDYELKSENINIIVSDPFVQDSSINGCGNFRLQTQSIPNQVFQGQKFTWWVKLSGYGDANRINKPEPIVQDLIKYYPEPDGPVESQVDQDGIRNSLSYQYTLVAEDTGTVELRLPFYYFNSTLDKIDSIILTETVQINASSSSNFNEPNEFSDEEVVTTTEYLSKKITIALISLIIMTILVIWLMKRKKIQGNKVKKPILPTNKLADNYSVNQNNTLLQKYAFENNPEEFFKVMKIDMAEINKRLVINNEAINENLDFYSILTKHNLTAQDIENWEKLKQHADSFLYGMKAIDIEMLNELQLQYETLRRKILKTRQ